MFIYDWNEKIVPYNIFWHRYDKTIFKESKNCKDSLDKIKYLNLNNIIVDVYVYM